jgi:hypothetical protein
MTEWANRKSGFGSWPWQNVLLSRHHQGLLHRNICYDCGSRFGWKVSTNLPDSTASYSRRQLSLPPQRHTSHVGMNTRPYAPAWDRLCGHRTACIGSVAHCLHLPTHAA